MIETKVSKGIVSTYFDKLQRNLELDVAIVGGGPSGIVAAYYLAKAGLKVAQFDRKLAPGGGMWGGVGRRHDVQPNRYPGGGDGHRARLRD